ncbi:uncharacterized protein LOC122320097 [Drosophila ficusphila]|uniref:uncharacterized protein LOC122320097 n=1 Tax=Drosophila ficusphila TaxID=30025 RepID=UPI001C891E2A|nr:uncharacterized protein LOC122320097 [Drosophila ficusphila]
MLLQELWLRKLDWDELLPMQLQTSWEAFKATLLQLPKVKVTRFVHTDPQVPIEIHGFADASMRAYGAGIYVRTQTAEGVKSAKHLFLRTVGHDLLTAEELGTLLASVEAVLNSRPIGALSSDPSDGEALTPGHLLIGGPLVAPPPSALPDQISPTCLRLWRSVSSLRHRFWQRWSREYVSSLQTRQKWSKEVHNVDVGALVVVGEDNLPPQQWRIGRVVEVHVGADGKVRVADVKTADGVYRRAIHRLALLPMLS